MTTSFYITLLATLAAALVAYRGIRIQTNKSNQMTTRNKRIVILFTRGTIWCGLLGTIWLAVIEFGGISQLQFGRYLAIALIAIFLLVWVTLGLFVAVLTIFNAHQRI